MEEERNKKFEEYLHATPTERRKFDLSFLNKPSLPESLEEAAENAWALYEYRESPKGRFVDGFKAGAEWMAKQGLTIEGVCSDGEFIDTDHGILSFDERPFDDSDKVIVQIRKAE